MSYFCVNADIYREGIQQREVMRSQNGSKNMVHFSTLTLLISGEKVCVAKRVNGESVANTVEAYFREKSNLPN